MTKLANELLNIIRNSERHMTAEELFLQCKNDNIRISLASVYRNLGTMAEDGLIKKVSIPGESDRYDKTMIPHGHLICKKCKQVKDTHVRDLQHILEMSVGSEIDSYDLCIYYVCPECRRVERGNAVI